MARSDPPEKTATRAGVAAANRGEAPLPRRYFPVARRHGFFDRMASRVTRAVGSPTAFALAVLVVLVWAVTGPLFRFSETWQLVINTGTTIVTFLMVFVIQQAQNKDSVAIHLKLNELLASHRFASNRLVAVEDLDEQELLTLRGYYCELAKLAAKAAGVKETHSIDEAEQAHARKRRRSGDKGATPESG